ncbi:hypothetical protein ACF0H5_002671 [Mactra antiquata]
MNTVNLHLPSRFGLVQFKRDINDKTFYFELWHLYRVLFVIFEAENKYKSVNGMYITELDELSIPPKIVSSDCITLSISVNGTSFTASVRSKLNPNLPVANIREDRYVWFDNR